LTHDWAEGGAVAFLDCFQAGVHGVANLLVYFVELCMIGVFKGGGDTSVYLMVIAVGVNGIDLSFATLVISGMELGGFGRCKFGRQAAKELFGIKVDEDGSVVGTGQDVKREDAASGNSG
jgi:hypothetical protein